MTSADGLEIFADRLNPDVVEVVRSWDGDHALADLQLSLRGHTDLKPFLDAYAEAVVARHLLERGCTLAIEVPTPSGRACDFEVVAGDEIFYLHVKRVHNDRPAHRRLTISSRLRMLERVRRPYVVSVRWQEGTTDSQMQRLVREAAEFIAHARVGDELLVRDDDGSEIGGVLVVAPASGRHVSLTIGLPTGYIDEAPRMRKLLRRAYRQFMPRAANVILLCSSQADEHEDFETALLGSHEERWDAHPPPGRRVAHGRADDGFWANHRYESSASAGWFALDTRAGTLGVRMWHRDRPAPRPALRATLDRLFG